MPGTTKRFAGDNPSPVADVWDQDSPCKIPTLISSLPDDLLAGDYDGFAADSELPVSDRDADRVRFLKRLSAAPDGINLKTIVSEAVKGQILGQCEKFDGSDSDYQFAYRYVQELDDRSPALLRKEQKDGLIWLSPTTALLDLIREGMSQTPSELSSPVKDRDFAADLLSTIRTLDSDGKDLLEDNFTRYIDRINDYRLCFEAHSQGRSGHSVQSFQKSYKTRFNSIGRINKQYARYNDALERQHDAASNAVLVTLTTDPGTMWDADRPDPRDLMETWKSINPNFNRLMSFLDSDPETIPYEPGSYDTSNPRAATSRPGDRPEYIKVLEASDKGFPHLHVLFFDVPTRPNGMPWLMDKQELSDKWHGFGQGMIVDTYPLTYRDDLDELNADFADSEGFVDWYAYGDHDEDPEWIAERTQHHDLIDFHDPVENAVEWCVTTSLDAVLPENADPNAIDVSNVSNKQKTAGAYLGKYMSAAFAKLLDEQETSENTAENAYTDKVPLWKLAMYWATNRRMWSMSREIQVATKKRDHHNSPGVREAIRDFTQDTVRQAVRPEITDVMARRSWDNLDDLNEAVDNAVLAAVGPAIEDSLPEHHDFLAWVEYLGCYHYADLPSQERFSPDLATADHDLADDPDHADLNRDRPPPLAQEAMP